MIELHRDPLIRFARDVADSLEILIVLNDVFAGVRQMLEGICKDHHAESVVCVLVKNVFGDQLVFRHAHVRDEHDKMRFVKDLSPAVLLFGPFSQYLYDLVEHVARVRLRRGDVTEPAVLGPYVGQPFRELPPVQIRRIILIIYIYQLHVRVAVVGGDLGAQNLCDLDGTCLVVPSRNTDQAVFQKIRQDRHLIQRLEVFAQLSGLFRKRVRQDRKLFFCHHDGNLKIHVADTDPVGDKIPVGRISVPEHRGGIVIFQTGRCVRVHFSQSVLIMLVFIMDLVLFPDEIILVCFIALFVIFPFHPVLIAHVEHSPEYTHNGGRTCHDKT